MARGPNLPFACSLLALLACGGCLGEKLLRTQGSPLAPARMHQDSLALEVFFVRLSLEDLEGYDSVWKEIDEQALRQASSTALAENGFRLGTLSGHLPAKVQQLLDQRAQATSGPQPSAAPQLPSSADGPVLSSADGPVLSSVGGPSLADTVVNFDEDSSVRIRRLQLRTGKRGEIVASGIHDSVPILLCDDKQVAGRTLERFQGELAVRAWPQGDGSALLEVVPEAHFGEPRNQFTGLDGDGAWRLESARPRQAYDQLTINAKLVPGEMLALSSARDLPGSLGHYFFSDQATGRMERKLVLIRLSQTQADDLFQSAR